MFTLEYVTPEMEELRKQETISNLQEKQKNGYIF